MQKNDKFMDIVTVSASPNPQSTIYSALHQCYNAEPVTPIPVLKLTERECGEIAIKRLLGKSIGHFSCLENNSITLNCQYMPHSVVAQVTRHRTGIAFGVQSGRYTSESILNVKNNLTAEKAVYLRPIGDYVDRKGNKYYYGPQLRQEHIRHVIHCANVYREAIEAGLSEEHARGLFPYDVRQHFVMTVNLRSAFHILDLRSKKDAQLEIQRFSELMMIRLMEWAPELATWYKENRYSRARLAP